MKMSAKYDGTDEETQPFYFTEGYESFVRIPNNVRVIPHEIDKVGTEGSFHT